MYNQFCHFLKIDKVVLNNGNRLKTEKAENALISSTHKRNTQKGMPAWLGTTILVTVLVAMVLVAAFFAMSSAGTFNRMRVVMKTDNFKVTVPMMSYTIYTTYQSEVASYKEMSESWGVTISVPTGSGGDKLDTNKPLRDQIYATTDSETKLPLDVAETWFDHYASKSMTDVKKMLVLCEAAKAAGVELDESEYESIDMALQYIELYAYYYGYTTAGYLAAMYGDGVSLKDVSKMMEISALAEKYNNMRSQEFTDGVTDEQVNAEYNGNVAKYDVFVDYITYTFEAKFTASTKTDSAVAKEENIANAEKYEAKKAKYRALLADLEAAAKSSPATYGEKLNEVLTQLFYDEAVEAAEAKLAAGESLDDTKKAELMETAKKDAKEAVENAVVKNADTSASTINTEFKVWVTDKNTPRKAGDVYTHVSKYDAFNQSEIQDGEDAPEGEEGAEGDTKEKDYANATSTYTIYLLTSGLKRNDGILRSVGHILFKADTFKDSKTGEALTSSANFSGVVKTLADRVLAKHGKLTSEYMAAELVALMKEEGKLVEKTVDGKTYYEMDEAVFEAYGQQYTEDSSVLYDNVKQGQMVKSFEKWMFDSSRVVGEVTTEAVETSYGHHIMLYRGDQKDAWSYDIRVSLAEGKYDAWVEEVLASTECTEKAGNLDYIS